MMRRLAVGKLDGEDAETPNVDFAIVRGLSFDQLGRHPVNGPDFRFSCLLLLRQLSGVSEIAQLNVALGIHKDVVRLYVSVHYIPFVKCRETS